MTRAEWTYEVPPAGASAEGLEEYVVEAASGTRVGKVVTLLRHEGELYVAVERGTPPLRHDVRAVSWSDVAGVDHEALAVRLSLSEAELGNVVELDPERGTEGGEADAERVTELPQPVRPDSAATGEATPTADRAHWAAALAVAAAGLFTFLLAVIVSTVTDRSWRWLLFALAAVILAAAGVLAYRAFREPYARR